MCITKIFLASLLMIVMATANSNAAESKLHPLNPVSGHAVTIDDHFWSPKLALWRETTLHDAFDKFEKHGGFENFDRVARRQKGGHKGEPWWDGLIYEMITASADVLAY